MNLASRSKTSDRKLCLLIFVLPLHEKAVCRYVSRSTVGSDISCDKQLVG